MNDEIKEILDRIETASEIFDCLLKPEECTELLDYITNLQQENERLKRIKDHYLRYRNNDEEQREVYNILELGKDEKNLHHHKNTGGLNWIDLPMTKFSSISSYIRARDLSLEDYKSRCEKASETLKKLDLDKYTYTKENRKHTINDLLNILQKGSEEE